MNVGTCHGHSVREVIEMSEKVSGLTVPYEVVARRLGDPPTIYADPSFARESLNWKSELDLEEIVRSSFNWYQKTLMDIVEHLHRGFALFSHTNVCAMLRQTLDLSEPS